MYAANLASPRPTHSSSPSSGTATSSGPSVTPPTLGYFSVYNPDFGPTDETQHEQLLYYVARKTVSIDAKMRNIGLAQGLVNFARIFSPNGPCDNVHSQKNRMVFYEAEPGYWLHMSIELGTIKRAVKGSDGKQKIITEYLEHDIHDTVVSALLRQAYAMFQVAHGTMDGIVNAHDGNTRPLQKRLEEFFEPWVLGWDFEKSMTLERALDGISYLPLSRQSYVGVHRVLKSIKEKYENLFSHTMVTYEDQLVSSDIRETDVRAVWKQVVLLTGYEGASLSASAGDRKEEEEARKRKTSTFKFGKSWSNANIFGFYRSSSSASTPPSTPPLRPSSRVSSPVPSIRSVDGVISTGSVNPGSSPNPSGESEIILTSGGDAQVNPLWFGEFIASEDVDEHYSVIFKHKSGLNFCFFAPVQSIDAHRLFEEVPDQFTRELEEFLASLTMDPPPLLDPVDTVTVSRSLLEDISKQVQKDSYMARTLAGSVASDKEIRFLYFNKMNLAIKAQLNSTTGKGAVVMGPDVALSLLDIKQDFDRMPEATEISSRSQSNYWIVGKRFEDREVYMIVSRKDSTLVQVEDEVRKLTALYFNNNPLLATSTTPSMSPNVS
ncbi:vacuolar fusion protein ccz1 [Lunasporangiospora selenospora]|uniref:Vacuolar fusion protein ccz1 n=1 Tax=Lunasporangiospora selenospora TaxID=979761 RepID=A0A9P6G2I4_9FUNG|nr:vacuolar fusion protein ccz1 [Lunasporangiospora selenospora]